MNEKDKNEEELNEDDRMGLLGKGRWIFGISVNTKWKIIPFSLAIWFAIVTVFSQNITNIIVSLILLAAVIVILRRALWLKEKGRQSMKKGYKTFRFLGFLSGLFYPIL